VLIALALAACTSTAPPVPTARKDAAGAGPQAGQRTEEIKPDAERPFRAKLAPGEGFLINFVIPRTAAVTARFKTRGTTVSAAAIAHPRSDVVIANGSLQVECAGIATHPLRVSRAADSLPGGTLNVHSAETGLFAFLFQNPQDQAGEVDVVLRPSGGSIVLVAVDVIPAELAASILAPGGATPATP